jgi:hypothetical protein
VPCVAIPPRHVLCWRGVLAYSLPYRVVAPSPYISRCYDYATAYYLGQAIMTALCVGTGRKAYCQAIIIIPCAVTPYRLHPTILSYCGRRQPAQPEANRPCRCIIRWQCASYMLASTLCYTLCYVVLALCYTVIVATCWRSGSGASLHSPVFRCCNVHPVATMYILLAPFSVIRCTCGTNRHFAAIRRNLCTL